MGRGYLSFRSSLDKRLFRLRRQFKRTLLTVELAIQTLITKNLVETVRRCESVKKQCHMNVDCTWARKLRLSTAWKICDFDSDISDYNVSPSAFTEAIQL